MMIPILAPYITILVIRVIIVLVKNVKKYVPAVLVVLTAKNMK